MNVQYSLRIVHGRALRDGAAVIIDHDRADVTISDLVPLHLLAGLLLEAGERIARHELRPIPLTTTAVAD